MSVDQINKIEIQGDGSIAVQNSQDVRVTIYQADQESYERLKKKLQVLDLRIVDLLEAVKGQNREDVTLTERLKKALAEEKRRHRHRLWVLSVLILLTSGVSLILVIRELRAPFDYALQVVNTQGFPTRALTGELDKLYLPEEDSLLTDTMETSAFFLTLTDTEIEGRIDEAGNIFFDDLPPTYQNEPLPYRLASKFYQVKGNPPAIILSGKSGQLVIERNEVLCCVEGVVRDKVDNLPIEGAMIQFGDTVYTSNAEGYFSFRIPLSQQKRQQQIVIRHLAYDLSPFTVLPESMGEEKDVGNFLLGKGE
ncbi:MAG: hypothetical protein AAFR59_02220 [Bacteroidota bacterium]